ncbi:F-box domain-containing protein [Mycena venus]|uniref:F-box domain-containing protein n=1 Tax=Mycena venus TaxID=2733690 RepID=A0A8H6YVI4_9AGAR|nr:F-box domain-containing protein [Mycena venus]
MAPYLTITMTSSSLLRLPTDILILILHQLLLVEDLSALSKTSRFFYALVNEFGWAGYQRNNPRPSMCLAKSRAAWTAKDSVKYDVLADKFWSQFEFIARPLAPPWTGKEQPILAINPSRLVVAAGTSIYSYTFGISSKDEAPPIVLEGSCSLTAHRDRRSYITALTFIPDGGLDQTLCVGFQDGTFERILLAGRSKRQANAATLRVHRSAVQPLHLPNKDLLESLSSSRNMLLSLSASGRATLADIDTPPSPSSSSSVDLGTRSWVSHLVMQSTSPYAAFGTSSATPLTIHSITNDRLTPLPSAILGQAESVRMGSAVYGICQGPPSSLWGSSPEVVVSGWYNGTVSIHDLRSSSRGCASDSSSPAPLRPVLTLVNSWSVEPIYSVSSGGGGGSYIAAGWARHSLVSLWDVRSPAGGFSVHAPGNDPSPVYSLILESSRLFGVTQTRPFVLDFVRAPSTTPTLINSYSDSQGPGITANTYPDLGFSSRGFTHFNQKGADGFGYYVTTYLHRSSRTYIDS